MKIDRHNYEEFFILYLDNELDKEQRQQVELFIQENPDLAADLDLLLQSKLVPDGDIIFNDKDTLMKQDDQLSISLYNYEDWLILYTDNELTAQERKSVEHFANMHPAVKEELDILQKTILRPEGNIIFYDKESLYRTEEKVRVVPFNWKRIAIAASLLLAIGTTAILVYNKNNQTADTGIAGTQPKITAPAEKTPVLKEEPVNSPALAQVKTTHKSEVLAPETTAPVIAKKDNTVKHAPVVPVKQVLPEQKELIAKEEKKLDNNLPKPKFNPNMKVDEEASVLASNTPDLRQPLTNQKEIKPLDLVTTANAQPLYTSNTSSGTNEDPEMEQSGRKNKLRGFFRKITRTFEKNTNIKATDEDDRLLLGGLAIRL